MGNTALPENTKEAFLDHPHLRGEYSYKQDKKTAAEGSPPLAWGIPSSFLGRLQSPGITPTCVGNTPLSDVLSQMGQDHPHLRGEYEVIEFKRVS